MNRITASNARASNFARALPSLSAGALLAAALALSGCATSEKGLVEQGLKPMNAAELAETFSRTRQMNWVTAAGVSGSSRFASDGVLVASWSGGSATGRYRLRDGMVCTSLAELAQGQERCSRLYRVGDNSYRSFLADGTPNTSFSFAD